MENVENQPAAPSELSELRDQCDSLRQLVSSLMVLLVVVSGTFNLYLWRQVRFVRADLAGVRPQISQMLAEYNRVNAPVINDFVRKLADFGRVHSDFAPILAKYGLKPTNAVPAGLPLPPGTSKK
jgi:hypothetical protein